VKQAGFIVLIGAFMPAVLVELAFISNPQEERLLGSGSFQVKLAERDRRRRGSLLRASRASAGPGCSP
jgi:hypothetical protein